MGRLTKGELSHLDSELDSINAALDRGVSVRQRKAYRRRLDAIIKIISVSMVLSKLEEGQK